MATLIPNLNTCVGKMTAGERRFAQRLQSHLDDDYSCWFDIPVGGRPRYSDFIVLHPGRGLLLLEVKDWKLSTIKQADRAVFQLITATGLKHVANPIEQVRQCAYLLVNKMAKDPQLCQVQGKHKGKLAFAYGYGVVLTGITRRQFEAAQLGEVIPEGQVICSDEMTESADVEAFQTRLWHMFNVVFPQKLTLPQLDRIRWHVFPEIRIGEASAPAQEEIDDLFPDIVKVMDKQQELLARSLGDGHRVIHGVAGSGKTMILGYRSVYLAEVMAKPILVMCFNITLAAGLRSFIQQKDLGHRIQVYHFHDWCGEMMRSYHLPRPDRSDDYVKAMVDVVIEGVRSGQVPRAQYGALLIDEGHDFEADWLKLIVQMVEPDTGSLLLLYDDTQSIYANKKGIDFTLSSVGINAVGRTKILKVNYRNTNEILSFAYNFARNYVSPTGADADEDAVPILEPTSNGRSGPQPHLRYLASMVDEQKFIVRVLMDLQQNKGHRWADMLIACANKWEAGNLCEVLAANRIPYDRLIESKEKRSLDMSRDTVKVMTMHSSKGLEFPVVVIPGVGNLPRANLDAGAEARLLYVAMTRATDKLLLTASKRSAFVELLEAGAG